MGSGGFRCLTGSAVSRGHAFPTGLLHPQPPYLLLAVRCQLLVELASYSHPAARLLIHKLVVGNLVSTRQALQGWKVGGWIGSGIGRRRVMGGTPEE